MFFWVIRIKNSYKNTLGMSRIKHEWEFKWVEGVNRKDILIISNRTNGKIRMSRLIIKINKMIKIL